MLDAIKPGFSSLRAKRSNPESTALTLDCFGKASQRRFKGCVCPMLERSPQRGLRFSMTRVLAMKNGSPLIAGRKGEQKNTPGRVFFFVHSWRFIKSRLYTRCGKNQGWRAVDI